MKLFFEKEVGISQLTLTRLILVMMFWAIFTSAIADAKTADILYWYDFGYASGELSMPPSGSGRIEDWHRRWPGHPDLVLTPSACAPGISGLSLSCPSTGCGGGFTCRAKYVCPKGYKLVVGTDQCECDPSVSFVSGESCLSLNAPPNNGNPGCNGEGNPINFLNGNKYQVETDYVGSGREMALDIRRSYNSNSKHIGVFGPRWHSAFDSGLYFNDDKKTILVILDDGLGEVFRKNNEGWKSETNVGSELFSISTDLWRYQSRSGVMYEFNELGQILLKSNQSGKQWKYSYIDGLISSITDNYGGKFEFIFNGEHLGSITTQDGIYQYQYDNGYLVAVLMPSDTLQNDSGNNSSRQYHYENPDYPYALTGITDETGKRYVTWGYDAQGRAYLSQYNIGPQQPMEKFIFDFQNVEDAIEPRVTVTNPLSKNTTYFFESIRNVLQVVKTAGEQSTNCAAANQYKSYYPNATLQTQTDWEGNVTYFERDTLGRTIKKTEALKWPGTPQYGLNVDVSTLQTTANTKITQTCWHTTHNKPERIIEPSSVTVFEYFDNGKLKNKKVEARSEENSVCP